ncbi:hypothetical protein [Halosimplex sp. J119]
MSTPEENLEVALDDSRDAEAREAALDDLETANDCDKLSDVVRRDEIDDRYRERALSKLAHPQCKATLETLSESDDLPEPLREQAEELLGETPGDSGAGP